MTRHWLTTAFVAAAMPVFMNTDRLCADSVTFTGSPIALRNITIQSLQGGKLNYLDAGGQRQSRPLDDVQALGFDRFTQLDQAEQALATGDLDSGLKELLKAMLSADGDLEKLWVHARLARVHDLRKEYVQSAGHAAAVMLLSPDSYWRALEPVCVPRQAPFAAVKEATENLQAVRSKVKVSELAASIGRMLKVVQPLYDAMAAEYKGPPIASGSTVSGVTRGEIVGDGLEAPSPSQAVKPASTPPPFPKSPSLVAPSAPPAEPSIAPESTKETTDADHGPRSAVAIDALLSASRFADALALCGQIEQNPGDRDLGRFLHQYGLALKGSGRPADAAVMFLRGALLYTDGPDAPASLIECAEIHRTDLHNIQAARRMLERAVTLAEAMDQPNDVVRARQALQSLPLSATSKER